MGKSSDQLREEIDAQRSDAGAKIDDLQHQVQDQVEHAREQVTDTASHVRDEAEAMMTDTVDSVKQTVEDFDLERMVQDRPLLSVGAAMLGGYMLGAMLGGGSDAGQNSNQYTTARMGSSTGSQARSYSDSHSGSHSSGAGIGQSLRSAAQKSGLEDTISNAGAALMGSVTEQLKGMMDKNFPGFSDKLDNARQQDGSFKEKARSAQQEAQKQG